MLVAQDIALSGQGLVALPTTEVTAVPILVHCLCVLSIVDGVMVVLSAVDLGDRDLRVLVAALPAFGRLLHFANLSLRGGEHCTFYLRHSPSIAVS